MQSEEESKMDIKGVMQDLVKEEPKEVSQEDAIKAYKEENVQKPKKVYHNDESDDDDEDEDEAHLRRMKQELLDSLERVHRLEKKLFGEKEKINTKEFKAKEKLKTKEKTLEQMKEKIQEGKERSREE